MTITFVRYNFKAVEEKWVLVFNRTSVWRINISYWATFIMITDNIEPTENDVLDYIEEADLEWIESNRGIDEYKNNK